ncbi:MAG: diguanylate cyclase, partial [Desulfobacterales bacterium]
MPGIDGFEVTRKLKKDATTNNIPIVLVTSLDGHDYKVIGYEAGADDFLNKPVNKNELVARVKSLLNLKKCKDAFREGEADTPSEENEADDTRVTGNQEVRSILLYTSNANDAKSIQMYLQGQNYRLKVLDCVNEAIETIQKENIELFMAEHALKDSICAEIFKSIKQNNATKNTQLLMLTTRDKLEESLTDIELWSDDFLVKPINIHELRARTRVLIKKKEYFGRLYAGTHKPVKVAITDELSGLYNREYFEHFLDHEIKRSLRQKAPVTLILMEIEVHALPANDAGHFAGENIVKKTADIIKNNIREVDFAARLSEMKYVITLPGTDFDTGQMVIRRLNRLLQSLYSSMYADDTGKPPSVIFGCAVYPSDAESSELLISAAQKALDISKMEYQERCRALTDPAPTGGD